MEIIWKYIDNILICKYMDVFYYINTLIYLNIAYIISSYMSYVINILIYLYIYRERDLGRELQLGVI